MSVRRVFIPLLCALYINDDSYVKGYYGVSFFILSILLNNFTHVLQRVPTMTTRYEWIKLNALEKWLFNNFETYYLPYTSSIMTYDFFFLHFGFIRKVLDQSLLDMIRISLSFTNQFRHQLYMN